MPLSPTVEFAAFFLGAVLIARLFLYWRPTESPTIGSLRLHHYMFGIIGALLGLTLHSLILYAIGLGLFIDEVTFLAIGGKSHKDNYSSASIIGTCVLAVIVVLMSKVLIAPFTS